MIIRMVLKSGFFVDTECKEFSCGKAGNGDFASYTYEYGKNASEVKNTIHSVKFSEIAAFIVVKH